MQESMLMRSGISLFGEADMIATSSMTSAFSVKAILDCVRSGELDIAMLRADTPEATESSDFKVIGLTPGSDTPGIFASSARTTPL